MFANSSGRPDRWLAAVCLALVLCGWQASRASAQSKAPAARQLPFSPGEELIYQARFSRGLLRRVEVAEFRFSASQTQTTPKDASNHDPIDTLHFTGDVASKGFFVRLFGWHFHQHVESSVDRIAFTALQTNKLDEFGKRARTSEALFNHKDHTVAWTERDPNNGSQPTRTVSAQFAEPVQDVLSAIYFLRTQQLEPGKSFEIQLFDSGRVYLLPVAVVERRRIKTALGSLYALRVEPALFGGRGMVRRAGRLSIWLTDDRRHLPVWAELKLDAGNCDIKLKRVSHNPTAVKF